MKFWVGKFWVGVTDNSGFSHLAAVNNLPERNPKAGELVLVRSRRHAAQQITALLAPVTP